MSRDARKKEKQRLKRKRKQLTRRKQQNVSLSRRLADGQTLDCRINGNWKEQGMASILMLRRLRDGTSAMGGFLVDIWCVGLKDAWARPGVAREEFDDSMERVGGQGAPMVKCDLDLARRLVAAGIRFARQNGFRLPAGYDRYFGLLDNNLPDPATADLSNFGGPDGKLRYMGTPEFLRQRLVGSVEEFLARPDVEWVMGPGPGDFDEDWDEDEELDEEDEEGDLGEALMERVDRFADAVRKWCFANGTQPEDKLHEAVAMLMMGTASLAGEVGPDGQLPAGSSDRLKAAARDAMRRLLPPEDHAAVERALDQVERFTVQADTPQQFLENLGEPPDKDE